MTDEVFDQEKAKPKYELYDISVKYPDVTLVDAVSAYPDGIYDVNSLYPEKVADNMEDFYSKYYGVKHPGYDAPDSVIDAFYSEIARQDDEYDKTWRGRIERAFLFIFKPIAFGIIFPIWEIREKIEDWKWRRGQRRG